MKRTKVLATSILTVLLVFILLFPEPIVLSISSSSLKKRADVSIITGADWDNVIDHLRDQRNTASYIIYKDGSTIKALNGTNGNVDYSGTNATTIIKNANDALTNGGSIFIKKASTKYFIDRPVGISSNITVDSDYAILSANWASDYSPTDLGLFANFPPILYNKNYGPSYGSNQKITIRNLVLEGNGGQVGAEPGGAMPLKFRGVNDLRIENVIIDNQALGGSTHATMAQAAIGLDGYNNRTRITGLTIRGGWAGIYGWPPIGTPPLGYPTVANGANLYTTISDFHIELAGDSDPFALIMYLGIDISNGHLVYNRDLGFDIQRAERVNINNLVMTLKGADGSAFSTDKWVRDLNVNNVFFEVKGTGSYSFMGLGANVSKTIWTNIVIRRNSALLLNAIDLTNNAPSNATIANVDFSDATNASRVLINTGGGLGNLKLKHVLGYVTENTVTFTSISNNTWVSHGLDVTPTKITITLANQGYAWYGSINSTKVQVYFSRASASGTMRAEQ